MYIDIVPNRGSRPAILLRESYRQGNKVKKRTLANLSSLSDRQVESLRRVLRGETLVPAGQMFEIVRSLPHGHVEAVRTTMRRLRFDALVASVPSAERSRVLAMVAVQILSPRSKLSMTRWWKTTTVPDVFGVANDTEQELYAALDWLAERQERIERKLAKRHLTEGGMMLYDVSSSYFEGKTCPLAALGHNRDGKKGKLQVNYGLLTDAKGRPVAVSVFQGNTSDSTTLLSEVKKVRERFGIKTLVVVGDRGMIGQKQIDRLKELEGVGWITALKSGAIEKLIESKPIQMGLFDERNLFEFTHPDFPNERLIACRNPALARRRAETRQSLLAATSRELDKVKRMAGKRYKGKDAIGVRVGKVINKYKVAKHFELDIRETSFEYRIREESVAAEAALDGIYIVRTSLPATELSADDAVRSYKRLTQVEQAFRWIKTIGLHVRPIRHYRERRVKAHIFLCMLSYYVLFHMLEAWRPLLFADEDQDAKKTRDPVAPAKRSDAAEAKAATQVLDDGTAVHSFESLLHRLSTIVRNDCRLKDDADDTTTFPMITTPDAHQQRALDLLEAIRL